ncbi:MAG: glycosyltransferase [Calditrichaceae bacterium]|nr:glycosyltransferase [Calditrichaceae bacterium]MBN2708169.1 glycosyltransferase [Calditrichaceae bacterium]RQV97167.1 MAG: glycosyltransferase [Calditrichota bacterium]
MRILLVNKYHHITGGADTYYFQLRKLLKENNHDVAEFCMCHPKNEHSDYRRYFIKSVTNENWNKVSLVESIRAFFNAIYNFEARRQFKKLVDDFKPEIIHIQNMFYQISPSILSIAKKKNIPVVETLHDYHLVCPNHFLFHHGKICEDCIHKNLFSVLKNRCYNDSFSASLLAFCAATAHRMFGLYRSGISLWISPSHFLKRKMVEGGIPDRKIAVIPYPFGINKELSPGFKEGNYVLYLGRLTTQKGIKTFIKASEQIKNIKFLIAGLGYLEDYIKTYLKTHSLSNIQFFGKVSNAEAINLILNSKFVVVPSEWYDNLPFVVLESMSCGKPVIGSDIGGIPEMITPEVGFTFEPGNIAQLVDLIIKLNDDVELRKKMGKNAIEKILNYYNPELHYKKLEKLYKKEWHDK